MGKHAYINIEPNNGGIVLNVSDEGLCFHSFDPVRRNGPVRFWFSQHNQRVEAEAELAWTDATQKGGLRFKALPAEAREQIRDWIKQPGSPVAAGQAAAPSVPAVRAFPAHGGSPLEVKADSADAVPQSGVSQKVTIRTPLRGFSGGFAAGLTVSLVVAGAFLLHIYRNQVGESLIRLGERFAVQTTTQPRTVSPLAETAAPAPQTLPQAQATALAPQAVSPPLQVVVPIRETVSPVPATPAQKLSSQPPTTQERPQPAKLETAAPDTPAPSAASSRALEAPPMADAREILSAPPAILLSTTAAAPDPSPDSSRTAAVSKPESADPPNGRAENSRVESARAINADATSQMFFEVGGFKSRQQAHSATQKLAQLGFPATAVHKNHLWADAYHVLVGPYGDDEEAEATHQNLVSHGFRPRPFERGSRTLILRSGVTLNGTHMPVGECVINWESYVSDAVVKFVHDNDVVATTSGKWVKREVKYPEDAYVYRKNGDGSRTLLEIRFAGMRQALVFGKTS
jgi:hypothetical protein